MVQRGKEKSLYLMAYEKQVPMYHHLFDVEKKKIVPGILMK